MPIEPTGFQERDRDLLVRAITKLERLEEDVEHLRTSLERAQSPSKLELEQVVSSIRADQRRVEKELRDALRAHEDSSNETFEKLEKRTRDIENFKWWVMGAAVVSGWASHIIVALTTGKTP